MSAREIHLELLLGRPVCDADGRRVGSIEEVKVDTGSGEWRVAEYVTGAVGALERLASAGVGLWLVTLLGARKSAGGYRIPWQQLDLTDPVHPRLRCRKAELERAE